MWRGGVSRIAARDTEACDNPEVRRGGGKLVRVRISWNVGQVPEKTRVRFSLHFFPVLCERELLLLCERRR